ncbi:mCG148279 [Mus musculus]|nr:mCG148279 [Mus musculus]
MFQVMFQQFGDLQTICKQAQQPYSNLLDSSENLVLEFRLLEFSISFSMLIFK